MPEILSALLFLFALAYLWLLLRYTQAWSSIPLFESNFVSPSTFVSVIISARNEEENIVGTVSDILNQDYPKHLFELIVVDDHSTDNTLGLLNAIDDERLKVLSMEGTTVRNAYKKKAIAMAIEQASGTLIVTTDADCRMGPSWLTTIVNQYEQSRSKMISSPVVYHQEGSLFERLQTLEFAYLIAMGGAAIATGKPGACNGANLAYEKQAFYEVGGFKGIDDLASGDDELLMHKIFARYGNQISFLKSRKALVYTKAKPNLKEFIAQRKRWASKATRYQQKSFGYTNIGIWIFNLLLLLAMLSTVFGIFPVHYLVLAFVVKFIAEFTFLNQITSFIQRRSLLAYLPFLCVLHVFYLVYIGFAGQGSGYEWKERRVS